SCITFCEKVFRKVFSKNKTGELIAGVVTVIVTVAIGTSIPALLLWGAYRVNIWLGVGLESFWCYTMFAARSLQKESMKVYSALQNEGLEEARHAVSMIVGRDTANLSEEGVIKAAVETVAENTSDGVIAPVFFAAIGGAPLVYLYKAVNTMDSMIGYKNERYMYFGRPAAKLDDLLNLIPARLSAIFMILASGVLGMNMKQAFRIWKRDRRKHASPNSAQTESVAAGALGVMLAGNASYFGKIVEKPTIGDADREIERQDIHRACMLMWMTLLLFVLAVGTFLLSAV
ncbi:MAG: adenosylcobinamide-phosphate synthase CbiB, partial [Lachnospiraceae bacterium]